MRKQITARQAFHATPATPRTKMCGTCGEKKIAYSFTDGECSDCHYAPSAFAETAILEAGQAAWDALQATPAYVERAL